MNLLLIGLIALSFLINSTTGARLKKKKKEATLNANTNAHYPNRALNSNQTNNPYGS